MESHDTAVPQVGRGDALGFATYLEKLLAKLLYGCYGEGVRGSTLQLRTPAAAAVRYPPPHNVRFGPRRPSPRAWVAGRSRRSTARRPC